MDETKRRVFNAFYAAVKDMRAKQKSYFARRSSEALTASKAAERKVDDLVKAIGNGSAFLTQEVLPI